MPRNLRRLLLAITVVAGLAVAGCGSSTQSDPPAKESGQSFERSDSCETDPACSAAMDQLQDDSSSTQSPSESYDTNPYGDTPLPSDEQEQAEIECFDSGRTDCVPE